jgi:hypothetical protein
VEAEFEYEIGDVIRVETNVGELLFVNETKKRVHILGLRLSDDEWNQACFCALFNRKDDSVSIV